MDPGRKEDLTQDQKAFPPNSNASGGGMIGDDAHGSESVARDENTNNDAANTAANGAVDIEKASASSASSAMQPAQPTVSSTTSRRRSSISRIPSRQPSISPPKSLPREIVFIALITTSQLLTQSALAISITPLRSIGSTFSVSSSPGDLSWFAAAYSLTVGSFILAAGQLGDLLGHKRVFLAGYAWFAVWSVVTGLSAYSEAVVFFDFCRAMQGIGPAVLLPTALAILGRTYQNGRRKEMVFAVFGAAAPNGFLVGAVFSGLLTERLWWPWAYWILGIFCVLCLIVGWAVIPKEVDEGREGSWRDFDWKGCLVGVAGLVLFNVAWNQAPIVGWQTPYVIVLLILGLLFFGVFGLVEKRVRRPLLPLSGLSPKAGFVLGCVALGWSSFGIWLYYFWQFLGNLRGYSPLSITAQASPSGISGAIAALLTGYMLSRIRTAYIMVMAMVGFCVGNVLLATMPVDQTYWIQAFLAVVITPFGMDLSFPAATIILSDAVSKEHQGIAASLVATVVNYSISIGLGIAGTIEAHVSDEGRDLLKGYRGAWYAAIGLSGCGILLSMIFVLHTVRRAS